MKLKNRKSGFWLRLFNNISQNKILLVILLIYAFLILSVIDWGIPNQNHPFTYNMDEWHQLQAVRATFKYFSPNIPGSAHGTMFQFILTGTYLIPFCLLRVINPFEITSSVSSLVMQHRLFEILRLNTLIFGLLSIFYITKIAKIYLKINKNLVAILFTFTPLWLSLSNYFKYDIALIFWIILSLFYLLKFGSRPTLKNYLLAGVFCSLSVATKISALPMFLIYIISYLWFVKKNKRKMSQLFLGIVIFFAIFILFGIPDLLLGKADWKEFLYSNIISGSNGFSNIITRSDNWWQYLLYEVLPVDFGYGFFLIYTAGILYWLIMFLKSFFKKNIAEFKNEFFLLFCFLTFVLSLVPLKLGANGNRVLVLLPFFALLSGFFLQGIKKLIAKNTTIVGGVLVLIFAVQLYQSVVTIYVKWLPDPRQVSSQWIKDNLKRNTLVGIENIPIYQLLPDIIVKDFYSKDRNNNYNAYFNYQIIDNSSKITASVVIVANKELDSLYFKNSSKKQLIAKLVRDGYKEAMEFKPSRMLYQFSGNELNYFFSGLAPISGISIFEKAK